MNLCPVFALGCRLVVVDEVVLGIDLSVLPSSVHGTIGCWLQMSMDKGSTTAEIATRKFLFTLMCYCNSLTMHTVHTFLLLLVHPVIVYYVFSVMITCIAIVLTLTLFTVVNCFYASI